VPASARDGGSRSGMDVFVVEQNMDLTVASVACLETLKV
jgi:hypothetical protein